MKMKRLPLWLVIAGGFSCFLILIFFVRNSGERAASDAAKLERTPEVIVVTNLWEKQEIASRAEKASTIVDNEKPKKLEGFFTDLAGIGGVPLNRSAQSAAYKLTILALNNMKPEERKAFVSWALSEMGRSTDTGLNPLNTSLSSDAVQQLVTEGFKVFYAHATPEVKADLSPVIIRLNEEFMRSQ